MARHLVVTAGFETLIQELGLEHPLGALDLAAGELVGETPRTQVRRLPFPGREGVFLYFKLYHRRRALLNFLLALKPCRARREYEALAFLESAGVPAARPLGWGRTGGWRHSGGDFILTEGIPESLDLEHFLPDYFQRCQDDLWRSRKRRGLQDLASLVGALHRLGWCGRDLFFRNILTRLPEDEQAPLPFWIIDQPKGRLLPPWRKKASRRGLIFHLSCLDRQAARYFSKSERLRFFLRVLGRKRLGPGERALLRQVLGLTRRHFARRRRRLARKRGRQVV